VWEPVSREAALIDPGDYDPHITSVVKKERLNVLCTVNTHGHVDHIMGDSDFGYPVFIHVLDEPCLRDGMKSLAFFEGANVKPVRAARLLEDGDKIPLGNVVMDVMHTPGHTPGGISLRCGDMLFSGDTLFLEGVGRTDLPGGSTEALVKSIREKLFVLSDDVRVFPGHGPETTIGFEKRYNPFLK
jgi:glyoxylase-like metal-dependent hydrolase (beta-lactamase superfamily II)